MDVIQMDSLIEEQIKALSKNVIKQEKSIEYLKNVEDQYRSSLDALNREGQKKLQEIIKSFEMDQHISRSIIDEIESLSREVQNSVKSIKVEKKKASSYIQSLDTEVELYLKRIEDSNKLEIDDVAEGVKKVRANMSEVHDKLNQLVEQRITEIQKLVESNRLEIDNVSKKVNEVDEKHEQASKYLNQLVLSLTDNQKLIKVEQEELMEIISNNSKRINKLRTLWMISTALLAMGIIAVGVVF